MNVWKEILKRGKNRYGLKGRCVQIHGMDGEFEIMHSFWNAESEVELKVVSTKPGSEPFAIHSKECVLIGDWPKKQ